MSDFPSTVVIDNAGFCNLSCVMCDHKNIGKYRSVGRMDFGLYKSIVEQIASENRCARIWEIFFGEPCLCKDMHARIKYAKDCGLTDVVLNSNGVLLDEAKSKVYIESGLDCMYIGLDAVSEETYNKIRVGGNFNEVVKNIFIYRDMLHKIGNANQKLFVQFIESNVNLHELNSFVDFWKKEGVEVKVRKMISWAGVVDTGVVVGSTDRVPCYWLAQTMVVCSDGRVALCASDVHCRVVCGDITKYSMKDIWNTSLKKYRDTHTSMEWGALPEICKNCHDWYCGRAEYR